MKRSQRDYARNGVVRVAVALAVGAVGPLGCGADTDSPQQSTDNEPEPSTDTQSETGQSSETEAADSSDTEPGQSSETDPGGSSDTEPDETSDTEPSTGTGPEPSEPVSIEIPGDDVYPDGIVRSQDGILFVGSIADGTIYEISETDGDVVPPQARWWCSTPPTGHSWRVTPFHRHPRNRPSCATTWRLIAMVACI